MSERAFLKRAQDGFVLRSVFTNVYLRYMKDCLKYQYRSIKNKAPT